MDRYPEHEPNPSEVITPNRYEEIVRNATYYREMVDEEARISFLQVRLNEEVDEVLAPESEQNAAEKIAILWGRDTPDEARAGEIKQKMANELGDCIFYLVAGADEKGVSLVDITVAAIERCTGESLNAPVGFNDIDTVMADRIEANLPPAYRPDYLGMQLFGSSPFLDPEEGIITADGYYALHYALTYLSNFLSVDNEAFTQRAADALAIFSCIAQNRLDTSLSAIVWRNCEKIVRRQRNGTLQQGDDEERDRPAAQNRPEFSAWDNTKALLIHAVIPSDN